MMTVLSAVGANVALSYQRREIELKPISEPQGEEKNLVTKLCKGFFTS
jgi:hypothetical protein